MTDTSDARSRYDFDDACAQARADFTARVNDGRISLAMEDGQVRDVLREIAEDAVPVVTAMLARWILDHPALAFIDVDPTEHSVNVFTVMRSAMTNEIMERLYAAWYEMRGESDFDDDFDDETQEDA